MLIKALLIFLGALFVAIGFIGIYLPGLPTTPFLLLASACFVRSSDRLYRWLTSHKLFGPVLDNFIKHKSLSLKVKALSLTTAWVLILYLIIMVNAVWVKVLLVMILMIKTIVIFKIPTFKLNSHKT